MEIGHVVDKKYKLIRLLGRGGMGSVFEAQNLGTGGKVAVKVIDTTDEPSEVLARFQREARAAGSIESNHIVRLFDAGTDPETSTPYMVMERLQGEDLSAMLKRLGPIPPSLALKIVGQGCLGLVKAHAAGIIHRDIKPANFFLATSDSGQVVVKLLDFGIAKMTVDTLLGDEDGASADGLTRTGSMVGSPHYMSPEQAQTLKTIDHRSDIWSIGVVLFKALTGRTPNHGLTALGQVLVAICSRPPPAVESIAPWVPLNVSTIVDRCLRMNPRDRFATAMDLVEAIRASLPNRDLGIAPEELVGVGDEANETLAPQPSGQPSLIEFGHHGSAEAGTVAGVQTGNSLSHARGASVGRRIAVGALVATLAAVGVFGYARSRTNRALASSDTKSPVAASSDAKTSGSSSSEVMTSTGASAAAAGKGAPATTTVTVGIEPADRAQVEVDGARARVTNGSVLIQGVLGSTHHVRLTLGKTEEVHEVAITEEGALPSKLNIREPFVPSAASLPRRAAPPHGTAAAPAPASTGLSATTSFE